MTEEEIDKQLEDAFASAFAAAEAQLNSPDAKRHILYDLLYEAMCARPHTAAHLLIEEILDWPSASHTETPRNWHGHGDDTRTNEMIIDRLERWLKFHADRTPKG